MDDDTKLTDLAAISTLALDDVLAGVDLSDTTMAASGTSKKFPLDRLGGYLLRGVCQGRLTTESGVAVSTSDRTSQSTLRFTPYVGNLLDLYDGTRWVLHAFSEFTLSLSSLTSGKNYDVFAYSNSGTPTLELSAAWTNDSTRADALATQDGVYVKSGAATRLWLGTMRTTGTSTIEDSATKRFLYNAYNQVNRRGAKQYLTSHTYNGTSWRNFDNSTSHRIEWVNGLADARLLFLAGGLGVGSSGSYASSYLGFKLDGSATAPDFASSVPANLTMDGVCGAAIDVAAGYHYAQIVQFATGGSNTTFWGYTFSGVQRC